MNVAILGATGAVGREMMKILAERSFPVEELRLLASPRSAGQKLLWQGRELTVQPAEDSAFEGMDIVLGAAENDIAKRFAPAIVKAGAVFVDNSSAFRLDPDVPLVIPEVNPEDVKLSKGLIANPNCATIIGLTAVNSLHRHARIRRIVVSTYQAVSGAGKAGIDALEAEVKAANGQRAEGSCFPYPIAYNLIPQIGGFNEMGYSSEEMKMQNEGRKMLHDETIRFACTCVRVPIIRSHSEAITLEFENDITPDKARELLAEAPGVVLCDDPNNGQYPMPLLTSDQDLVYVGRVRRDLSADAASFNRSLTLFCCADQVRKGAATNAVQIAELIFGLK